MLDNTATPQIGAAWPDQISPAALAAALAPLRIASAIERATIYPYVLTADYHDGQRTITEVRVFQRPVHNPPDAPDVLPAGAKLLRCDVLPAERFNDMLRDVRPRYRRQYAAFLLWRRACSIDKSVEQMVPHVDFDPIYIDESVLRWENQGRVRFAGD